MVYSQRGSTFWAPGCSAPLRACSTTVCSQPSTDFLKCAPWFPWINSVPWTTYMHPSALSPYLDGWRFCAWNGYPSKFWYGVHTSHGCNFNRVQPTLLVGIPREVGQGNTNTGPGLSQNTTAFINLTGGPQSSTLTGAGEEFHGPFWEGAISISSSCSWLHRLDFAMHDMAFNS